MFRPVDGNTHYKSLTRPIWMRIAYLNTLFSPHFQNQNCSTMAPTWKWHSLRWFFQAPNIPLKKKWLRKEMNFGIRFSFLSPSKTYTILLYNGLRIPPFDYTYQNGVVKQFKIVNKFIIRLFYGSGQLHTVNLYIQQKYVSIRLKWNEWYLLCLDV